MFVRAKHFGKRTYYYLVENHREGNRVVQKVVKYLGKTKKGRGFAAFLFFLLFLNLAHGLNCSWTGATSSNWSVSTNWNCGQVPGIDDVATTNTSASTQPVITVNASLYQLHIAPSTTVTIDAVAAARDVYLIFKDANAAGFNNYSTGTFVANGNPSYRARIESASGYNPTNKWVFRQDDNVILNYSTLKGLLMMGRMTGTAGTWTIKNTDFIVDSAGCIICTYPRPATIAALDNVTINATINGYAMVFYGGINYPAVMNNVRIYGGPSHDIYVLQGVKVEFNNSSWNEGRTFCSDGEGAGKLISANHNGIPGNYLIFSSNTTPLYKSNITNDFGPNDNVSLYESWQHGSIYSTNLIIDENASAANLSVSPRTSLRVLPGVSLNISNTTTIGGLATAFNNALGFDGNDYVNISSISIDSNITVSAWIYSSNLNQNGFIVGKNPVNAQWELFIESTGGPYVKWRGASTENTVYCSLPTNNAWHHLVGMQTGTTGYLYIDGAQCGTGALTAIGNGAGTVDIGRYDSGYYFNGLIDEVRIFNRTLSTTEISEHYRTIYSNNTGLVGYWTFNEGSGSTISDSSGNGRTGTINGATWMMPNMSFGSLRINSTGIYNATTGATIISNGNLLNDGRFLNASGTTRFTGNGYILGANASNALGNLVVDAGKNVTHTAYGVVVNGTVSVSGLLDSRQNAILLDGNDDYLSASPTIGSTATFEAWASYDSSTERMLFLVGPYGSGPDLFFYTGNMYWNTWDGAGNPFGPVPASATDGNLHHYVIVNEAGVNARLYYDGVLLGTAAYRNASGTIFRMGGDQGYRWKGAIDEARVYNRALSAAEVADHYRNVYSNEANLVAKWRFSEGAGNATADESGNGNHGTLNYGSTWAVANVSYGALTINAGGNYSAARGFTNLTGDGIRIYGNFSHNNGTIAYCKEGNGFFNGPLNNATFYNILSASTYNVRNVYSHVILNQLNVTRGQYDIDGNGGTTTLIMGSATSAGSIYTNTFDRFRFLNGGGTPGISVVTAASPAYPWVATGGDWDWDGWIGNGLTTRIGWGDLQFDAYTGGNGTTLNIDGNMTLDALVVPNGPSYNDVLNITTPGVVLTGNPTKSIILSGLGNISGAPGNPVKINNFQLFYVPTASPYTTLRYVEVNAADVAGSEPLWLNSQIPTIEDCVFNKSVTGQGASFSSVDGNWYFRNVTFGGVSGSTAAQKQIYVWGDASHTNKVRCVSCSFDTVGFEYPSGWVYSRQHNKDPAQTKVWGNFSYTQSFLTRDMAGYWKLDEGSGSVAVDYAGLTNGTVTNTSGWAPGRFNRAIAFDGNDDSVDIPRNFTYLTDFTISAWAKPRGRHKNYDGALVTSGDWNTAHWSLSIAQNNDAVTVRLSDIGIVMLSKQYAFNLSKWYNVALTRNGTNLTFYVNGENIGSSTVNASTLKSGYSNTMIGRETYAGGYFAFNGTIDEVAIFGRALLPSEFPPSEHDATLTILPSSSTMTVPAGVTAIFNNITENGTLNISGALYRYKDYPVLVVNGSNSPISGASLNITDNYTGDFMNATSNSLGMAYPQIFVSLTNGSSVTTVKHNLTAAKSGQWNSVLANSTRGNHTIILGASQGYSVIGNITSGGFTPNVTIDGSPLLGPYTGTHGVEIRNSSQIATRISHDFTDNDFDLNSITVKKSAYWVGFAGAVATLYIPLRGSFCNVRTCANITNISETCSAGWATTDSDAQGYYCLVTVSGTVAEEQADTAVTRIVAAPMSPEIIVLLFLTAVFIFPTILKRSRK